MNLTPQDTSLRALLKTHRQITPAANPNFRTEVWARIEAGRRAPATWAAWVRLHFAGVALAAAASLGVAAAAGGWAASLQAEQQRDRMVARYVASIDPHRQLAALNGSAR